MLTPKETFGNLGRKRLKTWCHFKVSTEFWEKARIKEAGTDYKEINGCERF